MNSIVSAKGTWQAFLDTAYFCPPSFWFGTFVCSHWLAVREPFSCVEKVMEEHPFLELSFDCLHQIIHGDNLVWSSLSWNVPNGHSSQTLIWDDLSALPFFSIFREMVLHRKSMERNSPCCIPWTSIGTANNYTNNHCTSNLQHAGNR